MIKHELAAQISRETGYSLNEAEEIINSAISIILRTLSTGDQIKLSDFGRFSLSPTGRVLFKPYLLTKKIVNHTVEAPAPPKRLYKVRRTRVQDSFKEPVEEAEPRTIEVRRISTAEVERSDYSELVE